MKKHNTKVDGILSPEEVYGTTNTSLLEKIGRVLAWLLVIGVCLVALAIF